MGQFITRRNGCQVGIFKSLYCRLVAWPGAIYALYPNRLELFFMHARTDLLRKHFTHPTVKAFIG